MHNFVHDMLHNSPAAQRIESLWREHEDGQSPEAKFVKDLDRFEMASQARALAWGERSSIFLRQQYTQNPSSTSSTMGSRSHSRTRRFTKRKDKQKIRLYLDNTEPGEMKEMIYRNA